MNPHILPTSSDSHKATVEWKMKIDKLTLLHEIPESWKSGLISSYIDLATKTESQFHHGVTRSHSPGCRGYEVSIEGKIPTSTDPLIWSQSAGYLIQAGPKKGKKPYLRLDINPLALTPFGMTHLIEKLEDIFCVPWPTWRFARVSRIDIAIDFYGVSLTDWVWDLKGRRSREIICRDREVRTIYLGAKRQSPMVVYNKGKQDPDLAGDSPLTRVEYRMKYAGAVTGLPLLPNPFAKVQVFNPRKLPFPDPLREALMAVGHLHGRHGILATFPKNQGPKIDLGLSSAEAQWWDPVAVWNAWAICLTKTLANLSSAEEGLDGQALAYHQATMAQDEGFLEGQICN